MQSAFIWFKTFWLRIQPWKFRSKYLIPLVVAVFLLGLAILFYTQRKRNYIGLIWQKIITTNMMMKKTEKENFSMFKIGTTVFMFYILSFIGSNALAVPAGQIVTWEGGGQGTVKFDGEEHSEKGYKWRHVILRFLRKKRDQQR